MPPKESDCLLPTGDSPLPSSRKGAGAPMFLRQASSFLDGGSGGDDHNHTNSCTRCFRSSARSRLCLLATSAAVFALLVTLMHHKSSSNVKMQRSGPYQLSQLQVGSQFFDFYSFYEGADSLGSAGFNTYTPHKRSLDMGLINVTTTKSNSGKEETFVYMTSLPTEKGPRESVRLEGKQRFDAGLFILDLDHMPAGCGQWPAFWLTDEDHWPDHGEIDVVEGVNYQTVAKTALHTRDQCRMFAHVPEYSFSGHWDRATGLPDTYTGAMDFETNVPADNCWNNAPHQWQNQGCVAVSNANDTLGAALNAQGGGIYALQWDPTTHAIRSWAFPKSQGIPANLEDSLDTASLQDASQRVTPDPDTWGHPYAAFAIGEKTGCSADHFQNMRLVVNTAFCGTVAGNRFFRDCPVQAKQFNISNDPVKSCNAWIASQPDELLEAYWKIRGVYVYERAWEDQPVVVEEEEDDEGSE